MIGQVLTPISLLKKAFHLGERSLAREEVYQRLQSLSPSYQEDPEAILLAALSAPLSPFKEGSSKAIIEFSQQSQALATEAHHILSKTGTPTTEQRLLRNLRGRRLISWSFAFDRLGLLADRRFVQVSDGRWLLNEWEIVNDEVYQYFLKENVTEISLGKMSELLEVELGFTSKRQLFLPECDRRFEVDGSLLRVLSGKKSNEQEVSSSSQALHKPMNTTITEVAVTMSQDVLVKQSTVVDKVIEGLVDSLTTLEQRSNEMKEEVVTYFSSNNLEAIKTLMDEKEKSEKVLSKLQVMIEDLT